MPVVHTLKYMHFWSCRVRFHKEMKNQVTFLLISFYMLTLSLEFDGVSVLQTRVNIDARAEEYQNQSFILIVKVQFLLKILPDPNFILLKEQFL